MRLIELEGKTPSGAMHLYDEFEGVCKGYFNRGEDFEQALDDAFMGYIFDQVMTDLIVEYPDLLPDVHGDKPDYFDNVESVFKGEDGSLYPFNPMLTVNLQSFARAYILEGGGGAAGSESVGIWRNHYLEEWTVQIEQSKRDEESRLRSIKNYVFERYKPWSPPLLHADVGWRRLIWGNRCAQLRDRLFDQKNWRWVYDTFGMEPREPAVIKEWRENEDADRAGDERSGGERRTDEVP